MSKNNVVTHTLYYPNEHAFLSHWLGATPPPDTPDIKSLYFDIEGEGIGLESGLNHDLSFGLPLSNAVARLVLSGIRNRLPQWVAIKPDGTVVYARKQSDVPSHQGRRVITLPQHLFEINWASTAPGFCWPEAYYATWLPYYDVFVVTASQDGPDAYGFSDLAIGWFSPDKDIIKGSAEVIRDTWWKNQRNDYDQLRWECLFYTGLVDETTANAWADEIWVSFEEEEAVLL